MAWDTGLRTSGLGAKAYETGLCRVSTFHRFKGNRPPAKIYKSTVGGLGCFSFGSEILVFRLGFRLEESGFGGLVLDFRIFIVGCRPDIISIGPDALFKSPLGPFNPWELDCVRPPLFYSNVPLQMLHSTWFQISRFSHQGS